MFKQKSDFMLLALKDDSDLGKDDQCQNDSCKNGKIGNIYMKTVSSNIFQIHHQRNI